MNSYEVELEYQSFTVMTKHNSGFFKQLKSEIDKKLKEVQYSNKGISIDKALFLTCLCLAEDNMLLKKSIDKNITQLESQTKSILKDLELSSQKVSFKA